MSENTKKIVNEEQKPWAVVLYDEDGVDYVFFDTKEEADAKCDAQVALGYSAEVVNCKSAARRQAIKSVMDAAMRNRLTSPADYSGYYDLWKLSGDAIYDLGEADKQYVLSVATKAVADAVDNEAEDEDGEKEVEIDADDFKVRLHTATKVMVACLAKSDLAGLHSIARSLEEGGYGVGITIEEKDEIGLPVSTISISRFSAAMAKSLFDAVLDSFNEEED